MKSRIAFALAALSLTFAAAACVAASDDPDVTTEVPAEAPLEVSARSEVSADALGGPTTQTEYTYFRCSLNGGLYITRPLCLESCAGGTCRITLICKNDQGQQVPCP